MCEEARPEADFDLGVRAQKSRPAKAGRLGSRGDAG